MNDCSSLVTELREVHTDLMRIAPFRDFGLVPDAAGSEAEIVRAEARLGLSLPPSYRQFLLQHDGWTRFYDGARLFSASELGSPEATQAAQNVLDAAETPVAELSLVGSDPKRARVIPIGLDSACTTVFALEVGHATGSECSVVAWLGELGLRADNFTDFLAMLLDLSRAELSSYASGPLMSRSA